ncbi:transferrin-binding protein-like solute binding protein [Ruegeria sp. 6PALISEP08]|uniref:transferrin-binding protein-like solute binding protein n=1 Tax=Ruegeria sp. 6PALISEP08 TaxID=1225660 RepID=UPI00067F60F7|nr:transferrin-binding protein-like solute binding protein [Ruegeria sp. 6PALISEP08]
MNTKVSCRFAAIFPIVFLSACGGIAGLDFDLDDDDSSSGGSGVQGPVSTTPAQKINLPQDGTATLNGRAVVQTFTTNQTTRAVAVQSQSIPSNSSVTVSTSGGDIIAFTGSATGSNVNLDSRTGDNVQQGTVAAVFNSPDLDRGAVLLDPSRTRFEYQTFGSWIEGRNQASGTAAAGSYGSVTPTADMPTGRNASYQGASTGVARLSDGNQYQTSSNINVTTDFSSATISSTNTDATSLVVGVPDRAAPELDFSGSGSISNSGFTATVAGPGTNGEAYGVFYGPNAEEVGGTFQATGANGVSHIGAFGAD